MAYLELSQYDEALADFNDSIEQRWSHPTPYFGRGRLHYYNDRFHQAVSDLTQCIEHVDSRPVFDALRAQAHLVRALVYESLRELQNALSDCDKTTELQLDWRVVQSLKNRIMEQLKASGSEVGEKK